MSKEQQWRVEPMKIHGWAIHDAAGNMIVKDIYEEEIARFIVRAVNNYQPLKEAIGELLNRFYPHTCDRGPLCAKCGALKTAGAALALAEKES